LLPVAVSGVLRSESTPVSSTPGASVPLTVRSSDWRRNASWSEPKSTAIVLFPWMASPTPGGASLVERAIPGRIVMSSSESADALSAAAARSGR
jgi:hypothetical protein